jgi:hypothetical protein
MDTEASAPEPDLKNNEAKRVPPRKNGGRPGAGRKQGVPNKLTAEMKATIVAAFVEAGGIDYLVKVAKTDPPTFCALLGKILPTRVILTGSSPVQVGLGVVAGDGPKALDVGLELP